MVQRYKFLITYLKLFLFFFDLNLNYPSLSVLFKVPPKITPFDFGDEPANFGDSVTVQCTISKGDLPVDINWLFNGYALNDYLGATTSKIGKKVSVLTIDSVNGHNAGNYTCIAKNKAQTTEYTAELVVNG